MGSPLVSVIMPVYNGERFLREAVESILGQSHGHLELLAVDDGSTDGSLAILLAFADPRLRILRHERNLGSAAAANRALAEARGPYVARMDQDDVAHPRRLEREVAFLDSHPETAVVGSWARYIDEGGRTIREYRTPCSPAEIEARLPATCPLIHSSVMARREVLLSVGGYSAAPEVAAGRDHDLWNRLRGRGLFANLPEFLVSYRIHAGQMSVRDLVANARVYFAAATSGDCGASLGVFRRLGRRWRERRFIAAHHARKASHFRRAGDSGEARRLLARALVYDPLAPKVWRELARVLFGALGRRRKPLGGPGEL